jgi:hypothetical protein
MGGLIHDINIGGTEQALSRSAFGLVTLWGSTWL